MGLHPRQYVAPVAIVQPGGSGQAGQSPIIPASWVVGRPSRPVWISRERGKLESSENFLFFSLLLLFLLLISVLFIMLKRSDHHFREPSLVEDTSPFLGG